MFRAGATGLSRQAGAYVLPNFVINPAMQPSLPFDPLKDFAGISQVGISTNIMVVPPALGVKSVKVRTDWWRPLEHRDPS